MRRESGLTSRLRDGAARSGIDFFTQDGVNPSIKQLTIATKEIDVALHPTSKTASNTTV